MWGSFFRRLGGFGGSTRQLVIPLAAQIHFLPPGRWWRWWQILSPPLKIFRILAVDSPSCSSARLDGRVRGPKLVAADKGVDLVHVNPHLLGELGRREDGRVRIG